MRPHESSDDQVFLNPVDVVSICKAALDFLAWPIAKCCCPLTIAGNRVMASKAAPTTETRTAPLGLRLTPSLKEALVDLAEADRRTLASYVEIVLGAHVESKKSARGPARRLEL